MVDQLRRCCQNNSIANCLKKTFRQVTAVFRNTVCTYVAIGVVEGDRQHAVKGYDQWSCTNNVSY